MMSRHWAFRKLIVGASLTAVGAGFIACAAAGNSDENEIATSEDPLQAVYVGTTEADTTHGVNLLKASSQSRKGKSTGVIRSTLTNVPITCGATFVSHRYAVTAAHCVDGQAPDATFTIEQYNTTNLNMSKLSASEVVGPYPSASDPFPNYTKTALTSSDGYVVTSYTNCKLKRRCNSSFGTPINCPLTGDDTGADLALLDCANRAQSGLNWVPVQQSANTAGSQVEIWWFHELVNLATVGGTGYTPYAPYQPYFNWYHYGAYPTASTTNPTSAIRANNWHYNHPGITLQPLPLVSKHSATNAPYKISSAADASDSKTLVDANVPVCHGTSGSGVMSTGDVLVGVVSTGPAVYREQRLCNAMNAGSSDSVGLTRSDIVYKFTAHKADQVTDVLGDRK